MARNSIKLNTNFLRKETMKKEPNSWKNSKKLEKNQNITTMLKKNNKPLQQISTNSINNTRTHPKVKVKKLKLQTNTPNIFSQ